MVQAPLPAREGAQESRYSRAGPGAGHYPTNEAAQTPQTARDASIGRSAHSARSALAATAKLHLSLDYGGPRYHGNELTAENLCITELRWRFHSRN